jgi:hypothetical protein
VRIAPQQVGGDIDNVPRSHQLQLRISCRRFPDRAARPHRRLKHRVPRVAASRSPQLHFLHHTISTHPARPPSSIQIRHLQQFLRHVRGGVREVPDAKQQHPRVALPQPPQRAAARERVNAIVSFENRRGIRTDPRDGVRRMTTSDRVGPLAQELRDHAVMRRRRCGVERVRAVRERRNEDAPAGRNRIDQRVRDRRRPARDAAEALVRRVDDHQVPAAHAKRANRGEDVVARHWHVMPRSSPAV